MSDAQPIAFGAIAVGATMLVSALTGNGLGDILKGHFGTVSTTPSTDGISGVGSGLVGTGGMVNVNTRGLGGLPSDTALTGTQAQRWAASILKALGAPTTRANMASMLSWFQHEGGGGMNNPMNTTLSTTGATGSINSAGVKNYATPGDGVNATVQTLQGGNYSAIVAALRSGDGLADGNAQVAGELGTWSGGGYTSLG